MQENLGTVRMCSDSLVNIVGYCEGICSFLDFSKSPGFRIMLVKILKIFVFFMIMYTDRADIILERGSYILL